MMLKALLRKQSRYLIHGPWGYIHLVAVLVTFEYLRTSLCEYMLMNLSEVHGILNLTYLVFFSPGKYEETVVSSEKGAKLVLDSTSKAGPQLSAIVTVEYQLCKGWCSREKMK